MLCLAHEVLPKFWKLCVFCELMMKTHKQKPAVASGWGACRRCHLSPRRTAGRHVGKHAAERIKTCRNLISLEYGYLHYNASGPFALRLLRCCCSAGMSWGALTSGLLLEAGEATSPVLISNVRGLDVVA